ncbi:WD40/YVTN/BNR-like repeat-containing protein [Gelatiniphilus marinus]|uniref:WD40/YVTN/BNR-like repeat-containing protein n=1 Tax=Gelatiniphilus marinus TaxID=1759464 RepID=A0ABW5JUJ8_9FLAO
MRKLTLLGIFTFSILGCSEGSIETNQIETNIYNSIAEIDGLELIIIEPNENYNLRTIHFVDNNTGFVGGYKGKLLKTIDGGISWSELETNTETNFFGIDFIDNKKGFVVGAAGNCLENGCNPFSAVMLKTLDGGVTWEKVSLNLNKKTELHSVHFVNNSIGFAIGNSSIIRTTNGGISWEEQSFDNTGGIMGKIDFNGTQNGMVICNGGIILSTTNGGNSWQINSTLSGSGTISISLTQDNIAYVSANNAIFKSIDFGNSWVKLINSATDHFDINFKTKNLGFAVGRGNYSGGDFGYDYGSISYTTNGGENWAGNKNIVETGSFNQSSFPSENIGYIVSSKKIVKIKIK